MVKNLPAMQVTWVQSLGWENPLEKGMATHSSIFAWRIPLGRFDYGQLRHKEASPIRAYMVSWTWTGYRSKVCHRSQGACPGVRLRMLMGTPGILHSAAFHSPNFCCSWVYVPGKTPWVPRACWGLLSNHLGRLSLLITLTSESEGVSCSVLSDFLWPPWTVAHQNPLSMEFSKQEYWSGLPFPSPGDLPDPGIELRSSALQAASLSSEPPGKPLNGSRRWQIPAAAAKSLQSCPTLCDPIDCSPPGSPVPGILQAKTLEWVAISFSNAWKWKVKVKLLSRVRLYLSSIGRKVPPPLKSLVCHWSHSWSHSLQSNYTSFPPAQES